MPITEVDAELVPPPIFSPQDEDENDGPASSSSISALAETDHPPSRSPQPVADVQELRVALRHTTSNNSGRNTGDSEELPMQRAAVVPPQPEAPRKNKPMRMWIFGRTSSPEKGKADGSPINKAQEGASPKQPKRQRKPRITRILEERAASRRIDTQPGRIRAIAGPLGGGHLRYGALRFPRTDGAPTIWASIASGAPESAISAIRSSMWRLGRPTMLISIAGTSALAPRKERALVAGLAKVVRTTNAWLLTPGLLESAGVLVDRLVDAWEDERSPPTCIGVMRWEALDESLRTKLEAHPNGLCFRMPDGTTAAHNVCRKHTFLLLHKQVVSDREGSPQPQHEPQHQAAAAAAAASYGPSSPGAATPAAAAAAAAAATAALAEWSDVIAFERHVCHRRERSRCADLQGSAGGDSGSAGGDSSAGVSGPLSVRGDERLREPSPCALLLCVGGDVSLLDRILCHLTQGPVRLRPTPLRTRAPAVFAHTIALPLPVDAAHH